MKQQLNLYLISQAENDDFDTYDGAVVAAIDDNAARRIDPGSNHKYRRRFTWSDDAGAWVELNKKGEPVVFAHLWWVDDIASVNVRLIGVAAEGTEPGVILASFNAG